MATKKLWIVGPAVVLVAAAAALFLLLRPAAPEPADAVGISLLKASHNSYGEVSEDAPDLVFQEALDLRFYNVEVDVMVDGSHTPYSLPGDPDYLAGQVRLYVAHDCAKRPGTRDFYRYMDDLAAMAAENKDGVYGDGRSLVLNIDVKDCNEPDYGRIAESLAAVFDHHAGLLSRTETGVAAGLDEQAVTVCLTGADEAKEAYYALVQGSDGVLRAFADKVVGGGALYESNVENYFDQAANEYHRFYAFHWKHVEGGFPGDEGDWAPEDRARLEALLSAATARGFRIRFYALNGSSSDYQFDGGADAAAERWAQFAAANEGLLLQHFVATDDRQQISAVLGDPAPAAP